MKKFCEKCGLETSSRPFLIFKESSVKRNSRRPPCSFGLILQLCYYIFNISRLFQKFYFPIEFVLKSLQTQKSLELVFRPQLLQNFRMKLFILECDITWPNFINRLCLLPKLFNKMYFLFYAQAFDDVMKFENLKF